MVFDSWVRFRIRRSRTPINISAACYSAVFTGTKRILVGRVVFAPIDIRFGQRRRDQLHLVAERPQGSAQWWDEPQASITITVGARALKKATISLRFSFLRKTTASAAFAP
jgi:hypothetical protein